jgi:sugar phosphate isomerase/epimerase
MQTVWPGDGIASLDELLHSLAENHCEVVLSLELFNREYWQLPAEQAARTGLEKMKAAVAKAGLVSI